MFRAASDDNIEAYSDTVTCFIRKCIENVVPTKTIRIYPNQKLWINSDVRTALSAWTFAFKSGNTDILPIPKKNLIPSLNDWRPVALTPIFSKHFEKHIRDYICSVLPASLDPLQFAYRSNRSTDGAIPFTLHTALSHLENKNIYVRMLFMDYSSAFNTIVPATLVAKIQTLGLNRFLQLDQGLPDRQKSGGQNGQQHLISPDPQHWCSSGLRSQPTPILPVHYGSAKYFGPQNVFSLFSFSLYVLGVECFN